MIELYKLLEFLRVKGKITKYMTYRGYGFINVEGEDKDVFFHNSNFPRNRLPSQEQYEEFKLVETQKGFEAQDIRVIDSNEAVEQDTSDCSSSTDLTKLSGVGPKYVELLNRSKINNIKELSIYTPEVLYTNLTSINEEISLTKRPPTLSQVGKWIKQATSLLQED